MKKQYIIGIFVLIMFLTLHSVFAISGMDTDQKPSSPYQPGAVNGQVMTLTHKVWNTASLILRMLAIGSIIFAGIRYMFISADQRADIKKSLLYLAIGGIIVFCTTSLIDFVVSAANDIVGK